MNGHQRGEPQAGSRKDVSAGHSERGTKEVVP